MKKSQARRKRVKYKKWDRGEVKIYSYQFESTKTNSQQYDKRDVTKKEFELDQHIQRSRVTLIDLNIDQQIKKHRLL